jgi:flavin-dependent dehydrogenase
MYDAIVVGARCAGSPTAMLLARAGYRVLLLDRAEFPSDTLSTHLIHQPGVAALDRWGLLDQVRASGCPPLERAVYQVADVRLEGRGYGVDGQEAGYAPRRTVLDAILLEGAVRAGVEFRAHSSVSGLLRDEAGRVIGVTGTGEGVPFAERAPLVVGADGMRSRIARECGARFLVQHPRLTCAYFTYWTDVPATFESYERPGSWVSAVATNDGATLVLAYFPQSRFDEVRADGMRAYLEQVRTTAPALWERMQGGTPVERLRGSGDQQNFFREAAGPGWALVGDAGHHKDSITARGISDAFFQAECLAGHIGDGLHDPARLDRALGRFAEERKAALSEGYESTLGVARLEIHERRLALLRAVQRDAELTRTYFDLVAGIGSPSRLYTPQLLAQL